MGSHRFGSARYLRRVGAVAIAVGVGAAVGAPVTALAETVGSSVVDGTQDGAPSAVDGFIPRTASLDNLPQGDAAPSESAVNAVSVIAIWLTVIALCEIGSALAMRKEMTALNIALEG